MTQPLFQGEADDNKGDAGSTGSDGGDGNQGEATGGAGGDGGDAGGEPGSFLRTIGAGSEEDKGDESGGEEGSSGGSEGEGGDEGRAIIRSTLHELITEHLGEPADEKSRGDFKRIKDGKLDRLADEFNKGGMAKFISKANSVESDNTVLRAENLELKASDDELKAVKPLLDQINYKTSDVYKAKFGEPIANAREDMNTYLQGAGSTLTYKDVLGVNLDQVDGAKDLPDRVKGQIETMAIGLGRLERVANDELASVADGSEEAERKLASVMVQARASDEAKRAEMVKSEFDKLDLTLGDDPFFSSAEGVAARKAARKSLGSTSDAASLAKIHRDAAAFNELMRALSAQSKPAKKAAKKVATKSAGNRTSPINQSSGDSSGGQEGALFGTAQKL